MWQKGSLTVISLFGEKQEYLYKANVSLLPSEFGINKGRISGLTICKDDGSGKWNNDNVVYNYDRRLFLPPVDDNAASALKSILEFYHPDMCEACNGTGKTEDGNICHSCNGDGYINIEPMI